MSRMQIKKIVIWKCRLLLFYTTNRSSIGLQCVTKSDLYMTAGNDQLSGWTNKKPQSTSQSQTCTRKGHGHYLMV